VFANVSNLEIGFQSPDQLLLIPKCDEHIFFLLFSHVRIRHYKLSIADLWNWLVDLGFGKQESLERYDDSKYIKYISKIISK
jgi:hypothetical protein